MMPTSGTSPAMTSSQVRLSRQSRIRTHVAGEVRYGLIGTTVEGRVLVVIDTWRGDLCRVVTAFPATPRQQRFYMERSQ